MVTTRKRSAAVEPEKPPAKDEDTAQQKESSGPTKGRKKAKTQTSKTAKNKKEEVIEQSEDDHHLDVGDEAAGVEEDVEITHPEEDKKKEEEEQEEKQEHDTNKEGEDDENDNTLLPVTDDTPAQKHTDDGDENDKTAAAQAPSSSEEEGVVRGEVAPPSSYQKKQADEDEDELVRIEKELETNSRYSQIDAGTKKRLAVILEYAKVQPKEIEGRVLQQLASLPSKEAKEAMKMLDHSVRSSKIRNLSAYLSSMLRRMAKGNGEGSHAGPKGHGTARNIAPRARAILQDLYDSKLVREGDLDGKALGILSEKPQELQVVIMEVFSSRNLQTVRNMTAYFMAQMSQAEHAWKAGKLKPKQTHERRERPIAQHTSYVPTSQRHSEVGMTSYEPTQGGLPSLASSLPDTQAKHYALEQVQWGVRVDEFQALSPHAKYVHPAAALRLQQLWDVEQNKLVSVLDDHSWLFLAGLDAPNSVKAVNETSERMKTAPDDLATINKIFVDVASKYPRREDAPPLSTHVSPPIATPTTNIAPQGYGSMYSNAVYEPVAAPISVTPTVQLPGPAGRLAPALQTKIDEILGNPKWQGRLVLEQFDERAVGMLEAMPSSQALAILADFGGSDPQKVRNPGGYLIGCLRNAIDRSQRRQNTSRPPGGQRGRGRHHGGRGAYPQGF